MSWQNIFILMADYKLSSSFSKNRKNNSKKTPQFILFILTHFHQKINYFIPLKKSCCPHILLFLFSPFLLHPSLFTKCRKAPVYKDLKEKINIKKVKKEEEDCSVYTQKDIRKIALSIILKKLKMPIL